MKSAIKPREDPILDLVMQGERHLRAVGPDFGELNQPHDVEVAARRFKRELVRRIALYRQQDRASFKAQGASKTKIHRLRRSNGGFGDHDELTSIRLNAREAVFAFIERLIHVQGFL